DRSGGDAAAWPLGREPRAARKSSRSQAIKRPPRRPRWNASGAAAPKPSKNRRLLYRVGAFGGGFGLFFHGVGLVFGGIGHRVGLFVGDRTGVFHRFSLFVHGF